MNLIELGTSGRTLNLPATLDLEGDVELLQLLRVLPGRRYVAAARWNGRKVLAKMVVGNNAQRHYQRELQGAQWLIEQGLPTAALLASGYREGEGGWLLFDFIENAESLWDQWRAVEHDEPLSERQQGILAAALTLIGEMHSKGLWQDDLHLDNLLRHGDELLIIDGGGVRAESPGEPLSQDQALNNLAVFFAQLPAELEPFTEELLVFYLLANGEHALLLEKLLQETHRIRQWRVRDYLKKAGRECSLFSARKSARLLQVIRRDVLSEMTALLTDPDETVERGQRFKDGGTATVSRVDDYVIKRYNIKNFRHWLSRFWRPSRAWHSWIEGHRLQLLGIATPRPLAIRESRCCWLRRRAWLITEYCAGQDIIERFRGYQDGSPTASELVALDRLFAALIRERISHGDLKGHNILWNDGQWLLIDLDAVQQHRSQRSFARAYARDRARFLRNWPADSALYRLLDERIAKVL